MPRLRVTIASEQPRKRCSTSQCDKPATYTRVVNQKVKALGVPPYVGFYPCCSDCKARIEKAEAKQKARAGVSITWRVRT